MKSSAGGGVVASADDPHEPVFVVEGQHGRITGEHQVRPDLLARPCRDTCAGVIGEKTDGRRGESRIPQPIQPAARSDGTDIDPVRLGRHERPAAEDAAVGQQGQRTVQAAQPGGDGQRITPGPFAAFDGPGSGHAVSRAPIRSRRLTSTPSACCR